MSLSLHNIKDCVRPIGYAGFRLTRADHDFEANIHDICSSVFSNLQHVNDLTANYFETDSSQNISIKVLVSFLVTWQGICKSYSESVRQRLYYQFEKSYEELQRVMDIFESANTSIRSFSGISSISTNFKIL